MGRAIRDAVAHLEAALGDVAYNLGFHTAPHEHSGPVPLARPPVAEPGHVGRVRAGHRRDDQRHAAGAGGRDAARRAAHRRDRAHRRVSADVRRRPPAEVWRVLEPIESHVDWMADAEIIRFTTDQTRGRRHARSSA